MNPVLPDYVSSRHFGRRQFLYTISALAAATAWKGELFGAVPAAPKFQDDPFQVGVASGDPTSTGMVLWTRLAPKPLEGGGMPPEPVEVRWVIAEDERLEKVARQGTVVARPEWGHSVHVEVEGLRPDRWYWYQFKVGNNLSPLGKTRTFPAAGAMADRLKFAFASCQHYEAGFFTAYEHMLREDLDLVVHLGDYIYENAGRNNQIRKHVGGEIMSITDYRNRLAQYRTDAALQGMHAAAPWLVTWDDHEVDNNYAAEISEKANVTPSELLRRRTAAYQAYYEMMPLRSAAMPKGPDMRLFRRVAFGDLADFHVLDTRQYRTDQPCGDGNKAPCPESLNPAATLLGNEQKEWLLKGLAGPARWNVLAQQVMMARVDRRIGEEVTHSMDQWPGYEMERRQLLRYFTEKKISNPVVLTGDIHTNWANDLIADFDELGGKTVASEFVGTSISSGGDGVRFPKALEQLKSENPFVKFHNAERGYVSCTITPQQWQADYRVVEFVTKPGAPLVTRASMIVENGKPGVQAA